MRKRVELFTIALMLTLLTGKAVAGQWSIQEPDYNMAAPADVYGWGITNGMFRMESDLPVPQILHAQLWLTGDGIRLVIAGSNCPVGPQRTSVEIEVSKDSSNEELISSVATAGAPAVDLVAQRCGLPKADRNFFDHNFFESFSALLAKRTLNINTEAAWNAAHKKGHHRK